MTSSSRLQGYPDPGPGLRLHLNENTGGCSAKVLDAIRRVDPRDVSTYPSYPELIDACAQHFGVDPDWILLTNGLDEGILMAAVGHIARARMHDAETIVPLPAFDPYPNATAAVGANAIRIPPEPGSVFQTEAVLRAITPRTRMIFLNTPNNPTGQLSPHADLRRIAAAAPGAIVLIDEAYIEFGGETFLPELAAHPNVLIGRTFSKAYGLAGMRVGMVIGQPTALDPVRIVTTTRSFSRPMPVRSTNHASGSMRRAIGSGSPTGAARRISYWSASAIPSRRSFRPWPRAMSTSGTDRRTLRRLDASGSPPASSNTPTRQSRRSNPWLGA